MSEPLPSRGSGGGSFPLRPASGGVRCSLAWGSSPPTTASVSVWLPPSPRALERRSSSVSQKGTSGEGLVSKSLKDSTRKEQIIPQ